MSLTMRTGRHLSPEVGGEDFGYVTLKFLPDPPSHGGYVLVPL